MFYFNAVKLDFIYPNWPRRFAGSIIPQGEPIYQSITFGFAFQTLVLITGAGYLVELGS